MLPADDYNWVSWTMSELAKKTVSFLKVWLLTVKALKNGEKIDWKEMSKFTKKTVKMKV